MRWLARCNQRTRRPGWRGSSRPAYVDLLSGIPPEARIASAEAQDEAAEAAEAQAWAEARAARDASRARAGAEPETESGAGAGTAAPGTGTSGAAGAREDGDVRADPGECRCGECDGGCGDPAGVCGDDSGEPGHSDDVRPGGDRDDDNGEPGDEDGEPGGGGPGDGGPGCGGGGRGPGPSPAGRALQLRPPDLVIPLATLLGLADRPGEIQGFGLLDPALAREMAAAAAASPRTEVCVTVTSAAGFAVGHGCTRPDRTWRPGEVAAAGGTSPAGLPARLNLTVPATALATLSGPAGNAGPWVLTPRNSTGPPGGYGTWALTLPGGRRLTVRLDPVPTLECFGHRYESRGYQPSGKLRHLVQVRDGTCTFPSCNRHARDSDFEHCQPYDKGGKTCACNAGARSRACHRVKQSKNWNVTQTRPGWHQWTTPAGRNYMQGPKRYPA